MTRLFIGRTYQTPPISIPPQARLVQSDDARTSHLRTAAAWRIPTLCTSPIMPPIPAGNIIYKASLSPLCWLPRCPVTWASTGDSNELGLRRSRTRRGSLEDHDRLGGRGPTVPTSWTPAKISTSADSSGWTGGWPWSPGGTRRIGRALIAEGVPGRAWCSCGRRQPQARRHAGNSRRALRSAGIDAAGIACHMGSMEDVRALVATTAERFGAIDVVVNNAANALSEAHSRQLHRGWGHQIVGCECQRPHPPRPGISSVPPGLGSCVGDQSRLGGRLALLRQHRRPLRRRQKRHGQYTSAKALAAGLAPSTVSG